MLCYVMLLYGKHGINIRDGDTGVDVGANVGQTPQSLEPLVA